ncbi:MAG: ribulose-phosphate 3-epimerase [Planctomycetota bacterium]
MSPEPPKGPRIKIAPSLLAADFGCLGEEVERIQAAGADMLHADVMDGHFVPNLTLGPVVVEAVRRHASVPIEVHLMIMDPGKFVEPFARAGADRLYFHVELESAGPGMVRKIRNLGVEPAVAISPDTDTSLLRPYYGEIAAVLVMTVYPGFGGQKFLEGSCERIAAIAADSRAAGADIDIAVDGGLNGETVRAVVAAGANVIVAGTAVFRAENAAEALRCLRADAEAARTPPTRKRNG